MADVAWTLRPARAEDLEAVLRLIGAAALPGDGIREGWGDAYAVATEGGRVIGVAGVEVHGHAGLLRSVAVAPEARGSGLGQALTRDRVQWARDSGLNALYLLTTTAQDFFPRLGFGRVERAEVSEELRRSGEFRDVCPASAIVMRLSLADGG